MPMTNISKAAFDSVTTGPLYARQDLSNTVSLTSTRPRPVSQAAPQVPARSTTHQWIEQGRNSVAGAGGSPVASHAEGALPNTAAKAPTRPQNVTANLGLTAQVTEVMAAVWTGAGQYQLETASEVKAITEAMDEQEELATLDVLDFLEWMHVSGDSTNAVGFAGGQFDGLIKWITASGTVVTTGGTSGTPVNFSEQFIKDGARASALSFASFMGDTLLIPPELVPDTQGFVANGAGRPVSITVDAKDVDAIEGIVAGLSVGFYNTGFSTLRIKVEPDLSPTFNPFLVNPAAVIYNSGQVKQANLLKLESIPLAQTDTSLRKMVRTTCTQEHRVAAHAVLIPNVKSSV